MADATKRVSVRLSVDGAEKTKQELREVGEAGQRSLAQIKGGTDLAARGLALMDAAAAAVRFAPLVAAITALNSAGDDLFRNMARLQAFTGSVGVARDVYEQLSQSALTTGIAVTESVAAFQRFRIASRDIGVTCDEVARLVTALQRVALVSDESVSQTLTDFEQLVRGLSNGRVEGDKVRGILDGLPKLAEALAGELGVSVAQLRRMASDGSIAADRVFPALLRAAERVGAQLEALPLPLGRAMDQLRASTETFLGQLATAIGRSDALARAISGVARAIDGTRRGGGLLSDTEGLADKRRELAAIAQQIATLEAGIDTTRNRGTLRPRLTDEDRQRRLTELREHYQELQQEITAQEQALAARQRQEEERAAAEGTAARRTRATQDYEALRLQLDQRAQIEQTYQDRLRRIREDSDAGAFDTTERTRLETLALTERNSALARLTGTTTRTADAVQQVLDKLRAEADVASVSEGAARALAQAHEDLDRAARRAGQGAASAAAHAEAERRVDQRLAYEMSDTIGAIDRAIARNEELADAWTHGEEAARRVEARHRAMDEALKREIEGTETYNSLVDFLTEKYTRLSQTQDEVARRQRILQETASGLGSAFSTAFEDAIIDGKKLSEVLDSLAKDIARVIARATITEPIGRGISSALATTGGTSWIGSMGDWIAGLFRAGGGPVAAGQPYIVGEQGPEWFVPDSSGTVLPNGASLSGATLIQPTINIDARGADAGVEARLRALAGQIARQSSAMTLDAIRRGGAAYKTVRG